VQASLHRDEVVTLHGVRTSSQLGQAPETDEDRLVGHAQQHVTLSMIWTITSTLLLTDNIFLAYLSAPYDIIPSVNSLPHGLASESRMHIITRNEVFELKSTTVVA
jgi:hypothetical protein